MKKWILLLFVNFVIVLIISQFSFYESSDFLKAFSAHWKNPTPENLEALEIVKHNIRIQLLIFWTIFTVILTLINIAVLWVVKKIYLRKRK